MRWQPTEFIFKGIYLGVLLAVGLSLRDHVSWQSIAHLGICTFGTLAIFMAVTAVRKLRDGYRIAGRPDAFVLFLLLDNPGIVYAGVILGMLLGAYSLLDGYSFFGTANEPAGEEERLRLFYCVLGGAALGVLFNALYRVESLQIRRWFGVALGAGLIAGGIYALPHFLPSKDAQTMLAVLLLLGIPPFYLLTLASMTEESEVEIVAICAALGISLWVLAENWFPGNSNAQLSMLLIPATIFYLYTRRILPGLRVFKHVLRGIGYGNVGQVGPALVSLGLALQLDPRNQLRASNCGASTG